MNYACTVTTPVPLTHRMKYPNDKPTNSVFAEASDMVAPVGSAGCIPPDALRWRGNPAQRFPFELLQQARSLGFQVVIYTNGLQAGQRISATHSGVLPMVKSIQRLATPASARRSNTSTGIFAKNHGQPVVFPPAWHPHRIQNHADQTNDQWQHTQQLGAEDLAERIIISTMIAPGVDGKRAPLETTAEFGELVCIAATPGSPLYVGDQTQSWVICPLP